MAYPKLTETRKLRPCGCGLPTVFRDAKGRPLCPGCNGLPH